MSGLDLLRAYFSSRYPADTLVSADNGATWTPLAEALPLRDLTPPPLPTRHDSRVAIGATKVGGWIDKGPYAWRRYFARQFDLMLGATLMFAVVTSLISASDAAYPALTGLENRFVLNVMGVLLAVVPSALLIGLTGASIGKLIFGLRVLNSKRHPPGVFRALKRELQLTLQGLGLGIPLISFITLIVGYSHLHSQGTARWDDDNELVTWYRAPNLAHDALMIVGIIAVLALMAFLISTAANA